jgi:hypothetical protein
VPPLLFVVSALTPTVTCVCRSEYGRLGLGPDTGDAKVPTPVPALADKACVEVACGTTVSFAITQSGGSPRRLSCLPRSYLSTFFSRFLRNTRHAILRWGEGGGMRDALKRGGGEVFASVELGGVRTVQVSGNLGVAVVLRISLPPRDEDTAWLDTVLYLYHG